MSKIILHRPAVDNAGQYQDAGAELTIGNATGAKGVGTIDADRAKELLDSSGAEPVPTAKRDPLDHDGDGRKGGAAKPA